MHVSSTKDANWWGIASTLGLFVWFLFWFKNEPRNVLEHILLWGPLALVHWFGIQAAKKPFGWLYLVPLGIFWILVIIALSGGIPTS
jgi:hypothetical protein